MVDDLKTQGGDSLKKGVPLSPSEVVEAKVSSIPAFVFDAFNAVIAKKFNGNSATVKRDDVIAIILANAPDGEVTLTRKKIFDEHWLDVEDAYRKVGWKVTYDKPGHNEDYEAYFVFKK